ncbi:MULTISPECIES: glycosyltransferase family 2 protein [Paenibacillus]|uniref:glycosyltransferase family 2 protein n=1 Tax=Paenibacillus TaxID=44249 RepID=UPI0006D5526A|nr:MULTISPECIES: glycosyltransferase family 2 protein [Paenibacillus]OMF66944.1 hypothetical protein BK142_28745 [Paenibacillus glucanolyticus]
MPKISVLMPVYNGAAYLEEAIQSILNQTYDDFEFIIINDGSTDRSGEILNTYVDPRIVRIENKINVGIVESLNEGIRAAGGEFIVRMDADDFSLPNRLGIQSAFMDSHPEIGVCGSYVQVMNREEIWYQPVHPEEVKCRLLFHCCLAHPSVMLRRAVLDHYSLRYDSSYAHAEDYQLWTWLSRVTKLTNVPEVLLHYRKHEGQVSIRRQSEQLGQADRIRYEQLRWLGVEPSESEFAIHLDLCYSGRRSDATAKSNWIRKLLTSNMKTGVYDQIALMNLLSSLCSF